MQGAVCDGINTVAHPCCVVHDCKSPLISNRHRFCHAHNHLASQCAVINCLSESATGFRTCDKGEHRALEDAHSMRGKALFQLQGRLKMAGVAVPPDSASLESIPSAEDEEVILEAVIGGHRELQCDEKSESGNRKLRAHFGRRRTHNEQLIMRPCGVILSRATFFGSEAISAVNVCPVHPILVVSLTVL